MQTQDAKSDIKQLNSFLKDELSAVETYQQCIEKIEKPQIASTLADLQRSHEKRVQLLRQRVQELGGEPETSSGTWGAFAKLIEGGAKMFGEKSAISALEEGEDRGKENYEGSNDKLSPTMQAFINAEILPEHHHSHDELNRLKSTLH